MTKYLVHYLLADGHVLLSDSETDLQKAIYILHNTTNRDGMKITSKM